MTMTDTGQGTPPPTLQVRTDTIPAELTAVDRWVLWRWEYRKKWTKPPYRPDGRNAKSTDPSTWSTFATVHRAYQAGGFAGIGFVLVDDDDIVGVDLDHCVTDGDASDETLGIVAKLGSYTEVSPSGAGLRVLARAKLPAGWRKHGDIEVYETGRYVTITGRRIGDISDIRHRQEAIEAFHADHGPPPVERNHVQVATTLSDRDVLDLIERAANGPRFAALYRGDNLDYPSASEADAAFIGMLAFYTRDEHQLDRIYQGSGRARPKWDERRGDQTYGQRTIRNVLARVTEAYTPPHRPQLVEAPAGEGERQRAGGRRVRLTAASKIKPRPVRWTWTGRIPAGEICVTPGRGGIGKSTFHAWLIAQITRGALPGDLFGVPRACVIAAVEDSWERTIVPRLMAAGAILERVYRADVVTDEGERFTLTLPADTAALEEELVDIDAAVLSVDPLMSAVDLSLDTHKDRTVREALEPLSQLADRTSVAVLGNAHFRKGVAEDPLMMLMGSAAFANVVRAAIAFARDVGDDGRPLEDGSCVIQQIKNNLGRMDVPGLRYRIESSFIETDEGLTDVGRLVMLGETDRRIEGIFSNGAAKDTTALEEAVEWLTDVLCDAEDEGIERKELIKLGKAEGHTEATLKRARERIEAVIVRDEETRGRPSTWYHPDYSPPVTDQTPMSHNQQAADQHKRTPTLGFGSDRESEPK